VICGSDDFVGVNVALAAESKASDSQVERVGVVECRPVWQVLDMDGEK
jgi:hypothetical protein